MKYLKNVVTLQYDAEKCTGCGKCLEVCPHRVFEPYEGKVRIADRDKCMECGACARNCQFEAIEVDGGVGCAAAIIRGFFTGEEPSCG
jgi:NAD-dependent dihydropyrimidine dehydrogenase PreA subunit